MKLWQVVRFELEYRVRQPSTWIYAAILVAIPFLMMHAIDGGDRQINAPEGIALVLTIVGMFGLLVTAALFGDAATRDVQHGMDPLFYTSPVGKTEYLGGRFLGTLVVHAVLLLGVPLGLFVATQMPYLPPEMFGPFRAIAYVQPYLLLALPNLVLSGAILFTVAALTRHTLPAHLAGIALFVAYLFSMQLLRRGMETQELATLFDPFGTAAINHLTRYWTPVEQNTQLIGFPEILLWNRLIWLAVGAGVLVLLHRGFRLAHPGDGEWRAKSGARSADSDADRPTRVSLPSVARRFGPRMRARQTLVMAGHELREILRSRAFLAIVAGALFIVFTFGWDVGGVVFDTSTWPVTHLVAGTVLTTPFVLITPMLIALFAGELTWRERDEGMNEITDATPIPDWIPYVAKFLAVVGMLVVLQAVLLTAGVVLQAIRGFYDFELGLYLRILLGFNLTNYILLAALAMAVHVLVDQKYIGHLIVVGYVVFTLFSSAFGIRHNLLVYGSDPGWVYSDMNGFGPFVAPFVWFKLYWAGWALLLAVMASLFWVRGTERGLPHRIAMARMRLTRRAAAAAALATVSIVALGGFIFYNTNVLNDYRTPFEAREPRAEYERRYKQYEDVPQPRLVGSELRVEIYPEERAVDLRGAYRLVNVTEEPIDSVHVIIHSEIRARSLSFDTGADRVLEDDEVRYHIYALDQPLQPGDSLRLSFDLTFRPRGFPNSGISTAVVRNGAYFDRRWLPVIGYQPAMELSGREERREHGLEPRAAALPMDDTRGRQYRFDLRDAELVDIDAVVGTAEDQIAVTPGRLVGTWTENGRRYFHYRTEAPISNGAPFLSAEYEVREDRWNDVALEIFHHPTHTFNLDRMVHSMKASLDYFTENFGPYQYGQLRVVEFPRYASFARAHPHTIAYSEGSAFLTRVEDGDVDRPFFVTAHEIAHQWWGGQVNGARVQGRAFLSETLAQYSAMMVMEKTYGREQVRRFYDFAMDDYLRGRRTFSNREVPLLEVEGQAYIYYQKGAVAMYTLREHIGEERVNTALRRYLEAHRAGGPPYPVSRDLYDELRAVTPDSLHSLLRDLFEEITLWDLRAEQASAEPTGTGEYRVTLDVRAAKARADSVGNETEVPMEDLVEIGVFANDGTGEGLGEPLYLERHRVHGGDQTITVTVSGEPARAGIDPYEKLIEREAGDNVVSVEGARP